MSRILIFAEAVTLAHVARPIALSRVLRELGHEVAIAAAPAANRWLTGEAIEQQRIESIDSATFLRALGHGVPPYGVSTLKRYVEDDLRAMAAWNPDLVIGDFRLSLYISARLAGKPYGAIANAYWSKRYWPGVDAPSVPLLSWLPSSIANPLFRIVCPLALAVHALPFRGACRAFGVAPPGPDLRDVYTASDLTAFADVEAFYGPGGTPETPPPFIGPLAWEYPGAQQIPPIPDGPPVVFVSLGSSGSGRTAAVVLDTVARLPVRCIVATGTGEHPFPLPRNCVHRAEFVPYREACALASVVICNGGAPAMYAAWAEGCPAIAIPENLDQILNARAFTHAQRRGLPIRCVSTTSRSIASAIATMLAGKKPEVDVRTRSATGAALATRDDRVRIGNWIRELARAKGPAD